MLGKHAAKTKDAVAAKDAEVKALVAEVVRSEGAGTAGASMRPPRAGVSARCACVALTNCGASVAPHGTSRATSHARPHALPRPPTGAARCRPREIHARPPR